MKNYNQVPKIVLKNYRNGFIGALLLTLIAWPFAIIIKCLCPHYIDVISLLVDLIAVIAVSTTLYGQAAREVDMRNNEPEEERWHQYFYNLLSSSSYFFTCLAIFLR